MAQNEKKSLPSFDIEKYVGQLEPSKIANIGTSRWWHIQDIQQKLSQQAVSELQDELAEGVKTALQQNEKIAVLVHEAICVSVWKEEVFPHLKILVEKDPIKSFLLYTVLNHESTAVTLLEVVLYHRDTCSQLGDVAVDLVDYCAGNLTSLINSKNFEETQSSDDTASSMNLTDQEKKINFGISMQCIAIVQYLAEHMDSLSLSVLTRLYKTHDFPMLLAHLIDIAPWCRKQGNKTLYYSDNEWKEDCSLSKAEAHAWLAAHQLLLNPELGKYYNMTEFARGQLIKLGGNICERLLAQIPPLHELKDGLVRLASFQLPATKTPVILEIIPEIRNSLLQEGTSGWEKLIEMQVDLLVNCPADTTNMLTQRICETLSTISEPKNLCGYCQRSAKSRCSRCKGTWYCSRKCQVNHFPHHKAKCTPLN